MDEKIGDCPRNLGGWVEFIEMDEYWYLLLNTLGEVLSGYSILSVLSGWRFDISILWV
jgi:hypothetical protein